MACFGGRAANAPDRRAAAGPNQFNRRRRQFATAGGGQTLCDRRLPVLGNTLLPEEAIKAITDRHTGTNLLAEDIVSTIKELQAEYHARGYDTIG